MSDTAAHTLTSMPRAAPEMRHSPLLTPATVRRFIALVLAFTIIGLWLLPGASAAADVLLMKTGLTGVLGFCAIVAFFPRRRFIRGNCVRSCTRGVEQLRVATWGHRSS